MTVGKLKKPWIFGVIRQGVENFQFFYSALKRSTKKNAGFY